METKCTKCQDSGWVLVKVDGREIARPCSCRHEGAQALNAENANIPRCVSWAWS